jgi:metal-responsive CopG/Arc/MetJ family transcriptional regulator
MTRISVSLDDPLAEAVRTAAGGDGKVSKWIANLVREKLLNDAAAAAAAYDKAQNTDDDAAWEADRLAGRA